MDRLVWLTVGLSGGWFLLAVTITLIRSHVRRQSDAAWQKAMKEHGGSRQVFTGHDYERGSAARQRADSHEVSRRKLADARTAKPKSKLREFPKAGER